MPTVINREAGWMVVLSEGCNLLSTGQKGDLQLRMCEIEDQESGVQSTLLCVVHCVLVTLAYIHLRGNVFINKQNQSMCDEHLTLLMSSISSWKPRVNTGLKRVAFWRPLADCIGYQMILVVTWLILPVVICLSQRLSHACLSINKFIL